MVSDERKRRFEDLYRRHMPAVASWAARRADPATAQDIVAETFLVAWRRLDELPRQEAPWLLRTAANVLANHERGDRRRSRLTEQLRAHHPEPADTVGDPHELDPQLAAALDALPDHERELLLMVALDGFSVRDAAHTLGISAGAARVRLHRARRRIRDDLTPPAPPQTLARTHRLAKEGASPS